MTEDKSFIFEKRLGSYHVLGPAGDPVGRADVTDYGLKGPTDFHVEAGNEPLAFRLIPRRRWIAVRHFDVMEPSGSLIGSLKQGPGWRILDPQGREAARVVDPARIGGRIFRGLLNSAADRYAFFRGPSAFGTFTSGAGRDPGEGETGAARRWWKRLTAPERWTLRWTPTEVSLDERLLLAAGLVLWIVDVRISRASPS